MIDLMQYRSSIGLFVRCRYRSLPPSICLDSEVCCFQFILYVSILFSIFNFSFVRRSLNVFRLALFSFRSTIVRSSLGSLPCCNVRLLFFLFTLLSAFGCVEKNPGPVFKRSSVSLDVLCVPSVKLRKVGNDWEVVEKSPIKITFVKEGKNYNIAGLQK